MVWIALLNSILLLIIGITLWSLQKEIQQNNLEIRSLRIQEGNRGETFRERLENLQASLQEMHTRLDDLTREQEISRNNLQRIEAQVRPLYVAYQPSYHQLPIPEANHQINPEELTGVDNRDPAQRVLEDPDFFHPVTSPEQQALDRVWWDSVLHPYAGPLTEPKDSQDLRPTRLSLLLDE